MPNYMVSKCQIVACVLETSSTCMQACKEQTVSVQVKQPNSVPRLNQTMKEVNKQTV